MSLGLVEHEQVVEESTPVLEVARTHSPRQKALKQTNGIMLQRVSAMRAKVTPFRELSIIT